jgi:ribosomal protein S15P/S13E
VKTIVSALALFTAMVVAIWGASTILAHTTKNPNAVTAQSSVDVMQMTKEAKNLPEEHFDAH